MKKQTSKKWTVATIFAGVLLLTGIITYYSPASAFRITPGEVNEITHSRIYVPSVRIQQASVFDTIRYKYVFKTSNETFVAFQKQLTDDTLKATAKKDGEDALNDAVTVAFKIAHADTTGIASFTDAIKQDIKGNGSSSSLAVALYTYLQLTHQKLQLDAAVSGDIYEDGTIHSVLGTKEKLITLAKKGISQFVVASEDVPYLKEIMDT